MSARATIKYRVTRTIRLRSISSVNRRKENIVTAVSLLLETMLLCIEISGRLRTLTGVETRRNVIA